MLAAALLVSTASANAPVFLDSTKSIKIDLALPDARVCVVYPEALHVAKDCEGIDVALARRGRPARTELTMFVSETGPSGDATWSLTFGMLPQTKQTALTETGAAELAEGIRIGTGKAAKRSATSTGIGGVGTHTLVASGHAQIVRQTISFEPVEGEGEGEGPPNVVLAALIARGGVGAITVTAISPPGLDGEAALTRFLERTTIVAPAAAAPAPLSVQWDPANPGYFLGFVFGYVMTLAVAIGGPIALVLWIVKRVRRAKS